MKALTLRSLRLLFIQRAVGIALLAAVLGGCADAMVSDRERAVFETMAHRHASLAGVDQYTLLVTPSTQAISRERLMELWREGPSKPAARELIDHPLVNRLIAQSRRPTPVGTIKAEGIRVTEQQKPPLCPDRETWSHTARMTFSRVAFTADHSSALMYYRYENCRTIGHQLVLLGFNNGWRVEHAAELRVKEK